MRLSVLAIVTLLAGATGFSATRTAYVQDLRLRAESLLRTHRPAVAPTPPPPAPTPPAELTVATLAKLDPVDAIDRLTPELRSEIATTLVPRPSSPALRESVESRLASDPLLSYALITDAGMPPEHRFTARGHGKLALATPANPYLGLYLQFQVAVAKFDKHPASILTLALRAQTPERRRFLLASALGQLNRIDASELKFPDETSLLVYFDTLSKDQQNLFRETFLELHGEHLHRWATKALSE